MKKLVISSFALFYVVIVCAQADKTVESKITNVTVFLNKAQVTREIKTRVEPGKTNLVVTGLTAQLDQQSIQVSGKGNIVILGISHRQNYLNEFNTPKSLQVLKDSLEYLQGRLALETSQKEILNKEEQMLISNQKIGGTQQNLTATELKAMADFYRSRLTDLIVARMKHDEKIKKIKEGITKIQNQFNEENEMYSRNTSEITIAVSASASTSVDLELSYVVANAGWLAVYDLRAVNTRSPIQMSYNANVFQNTGEEWKNVKLKLSTANPSLGGLKPELNTWYLDFYQPVTRMYRYKREADRAMKSSSAPAPAEAEIHEEALAGVDASGVSAYTTTIQTSLNTEFEIALPYTVSSSNKPTLVDIRKHELKADYTYAVAPKLDQDAFLIGRATGWEEFSLLPGEANVFFEGTFVGTTYIDPNNIKDTLSISLGRDKRIVVKREKLKDFSSTKLIGSNQRDSYAYEISIRNTKNESSKIIIEDQLPISQNSQIEVTPGDLGGARYNKDSGKLVWEISLQPNETKKMIYRYEIKYPKDRTISGL